MRHGFMTSILSACLLAGALAPARAAETPATPSIEKFLKIRVPNPPVVLPDGSLLMRDWPDGVWQLYHVVPKTGANGPSYSPGEATFTRMTDFRDGLAGFSVSPSGRHVVLAFAEGGNENTQLSQIGRASCRERVEISVG